MKIISLTMVGNEQEIIESFIRYNSNFVDKFIIVSSCCIDNTIKIIEALIEEGYNIELNIETDISFDQRKLDNKYLRKIASDNENSIIIPLDCDEFIAGETNPKEQINKLDEKHIYEVKWKNYALTHNDESDELFIPKRCRYAKKNYSGNKIGKVLIPSKLVNNNEVCLQTGHHDVIGEIKNVQLLETLWLAHFPAISREQYLLRIYESSIKYITWTKRAFDEGYHIYEQINLIENGEDIYQVANCYGIEESSVEFEYYPLELKYCKEESLHVKYGDLSKINLIKSVQKIGQLMAIKAYLLELEKKEDAGKKKVLVYGTGRETNRLLNGLEENIVDIRAFIDSDEHKKFRMYEHRLVIPPDYIRFFKYDAIIISSSTYYLEMKEILKELGVDSEIIHSPAYLFTL